MEQIFKWSLDYNCQFILWDLGTFIEKGILTQENLQKDKYYGELFTIFETKLSNIELSIWNKNYKTSSINKTIKNSSWKIIILNPLICDNTDFLLNYDKELLIYMKKEWMGINDKLMKTQYIPEEDIIYCDTLPWDDTYKFTIIFS